MAVYLFQLFVVLFAVLSVGAMAQYFGRYRGYGNTGRYGGGYGGNAGYGGHGGRGNGGYYG